MVHNQSFKALDASSQELFGERRMIFFEAAFDSVFVFLAAFLAFFFVLDFVFVLALAFVLVLALAFDFFFFVFFLPEAISSFFS